MADCDSDEWKEGHYLFYMDKLKNCWESAGEHLKLIERHIGFLKEIYLTFNRSGKMKEMHEGRDGHQNFQKIEKTLEEQLVDDSNFRVVSVNMFFIDSCAEYGAAEFIRNMLKEFTLEEINEFRIGAAVQAMITAQDLKLFSDPEDKTISCIKNDDLHTWTRDKWTGLYAFKRTRDVMADAEIYGSHYWGLF